MPELINTFYAVFHTRHPYNLASEPPPCERMMGDVDDDARCELAELTELDDIVELVEWEDTPLIIPGDEAPELLEDSPLQ